MNASAFFGAPPHAPSQSQQGPGGYPPHIPQQQQQRQSTNLTNNSHQQQSIQRSYSHESTSNSNNEFETIYGGGDNTNNMNNNINNNINNNTTTTTNASSTGVSTPMTAVSSGNSFFGTPSIDGTYNQMQSHPHQQHPQQGGSTSYSAANNNTNANFTMATASSGPENFSVPQQQYQQHQQQNEGEETFEYEGVALQTALNAFGNVASVAGNVVGGVRNVRGTLSGASTGSMGNVAQVAGGVMSSITPSNIAGSMTNWRGRIADVVAPVCNNDQEVLAQQNQQYQSQTDSKAKRPPLNILGQQQQQQSSLSSSQSYRGRSNSYNSQQGSSIAAAQVFSAPSPAPPISTPIATGNNPNSTQELFRAPSPALSAVANSAQELFGSAPPTPTTASVLNLAASTNSMAVRIPNSNQQQQQQPQQMPPTSDNSWQMVQQKHQQSLVGDNASNFFGGAQTTATIAIQPPTSAEDNNANDFFNAPSPMMVSQPNSVEQLPPVALNISNNETINGNNTVNKGGDSNAGDHFNVLSSSQQQQPVPVIVEQPQNKRAFSHRLSSMEKSIHDPTTFQYDETLNGAATIGTERNNNGDVRNDNNAVITETILNAPTMTSMDSNISAVNIAAGGSSSALNEMIPAPATGGLTAMETGKYINGASIAPAMIDPQPDDSTPKTNQASTSTTTAVVSSQPFATPSSQMSLPPPSNNKPTSTKILPPVRKLHLPIPKKANLPLPPPLPTRRKPLPTSSGSSSNTAKSVVSSTSPFRKPPPMGINSASPRFNVPGPIAHHSPRVSPRVISDSPIPSPRVDEVTTKKLNTPQLPPPSPRVVETATIMATDSVTDNADTPRTEEKTEMPSPLSQQVAEAATTSPPSAPSFNATLSATDDPRTTTTSSSLVQQRSIADDNDWNLVVNSVVSDAVEKAINNVAHTASLATIPADASPSSEQQPLLVAPPEQQQKGPRYSAMAPPVYPNNEFPSTPSSRVTECDIMSDYQSHVHLEDYHVSTTTDNNDVDVPYSYTMEEEEGSAVPPNAASSITEDMLAVKEKEEELFQQSEVVETSSSSPESGVFIEKEAVGHPADDLGEMIESSTAISNDMTTYQALPTEVDTATGDDQAQLKEEDLLVDEVPIADALPEGWIEAMDSSSGKLYYHNQVTHESSWDRPTCVVQEEEEEEDMCPSSSAPVDDPQEHPTELDYDHVGDHRVNKEEEKINNDQRQVDENKGVSEEPNEAEMPGSGVVDYLLPEGWVQALDEASGNVYYCNQTTGVTSWERPHEEEVAVNVIEETQEVIEETQEVIEEKHVQQPRMEESVHPTKEEMVSQQPEEDVAPQLETTESPPIQEPLLEGWMEITDEASGQVYYFNEVSGITQWDRPVAAENVAVEGQTAYVELLVQDDDAESREQQQEKDDASNEPSAGSEPFNEIEEPAANLSFESLPTGWIEAVDTSGKAYYYHEQTNESSWDRPVAQGEEEVSAAVNNADGAGSGEVAVVKQPPQLSSVEGTASIRSIENITLTSDSRARNSISEHGGSTAVNTIEGTTGSISMEEEQEHQLEEEEEEENVTSSKEQPEDACDESLPPGWAEASDPSSGKIYYYNSTSGTSAWDKPQPESKEEPTSTKSPEIGKSAEDHLVDGNTEEVDATEKTYQSDIQANVETEAIEEEVAKEVDVPDVSDSETAELDNIVEDNQWIETTDPSSGKTYYYNSNTGETSWTKPEPELESNENPLVVEVIGDSAEDESVTNGLVAKKESAEKLDEWTEVDHPINSDKCDVGEGEANRDVSSSPTSGLPQGWQKAIDPTSGNDYYFNEDTGETSWELPSTVLSKVASEEAKETVDSVTIKDDIEPKQLPLEHQCHSATEETAIQTVEQDDITMPSSKKDDPGPSVILQPWQEVTDPSSGRIYYFHETTGETSWDRPVVAEIIDRSSSVAPSGAHKYRPRPAHAIASFAFGGRLCVMIPQVAATLSGATTVPQEADKPPLRRGQVVIHRLCNLVPEEHEYSISPPEAPLLKTTEDTVLAYLHEKSSNPDNLLWNIITIAALNRGRLRNDKKVKKTIIDMLLSSSKSEKRSSKCGGQKQEDNVTSSPTASDLSEVQDLILRGERESAVCEALTQQNYGLALLLASMCDRTTYQITARRFADEVLQRGSPLHTATLLFSNNLELPKDEELLNPSTGHSFWNEHEYYGDLGETWREQLASILSNQTAGWERIVLALGDRLLQLGDCHGAHACYLVSYSTFGSPSNEGTRLVLLGCDHRIHMNRMLMTPQSIQSFERTEAFEWARRRGNRKTHIPSLQPFKLRYAELLADFGHEDLAREYLLSIRSCLGLNKKCDGKRGSTDIQFIDSLKMLDDRICGSTHAKPSSWESNDEAKGSLATVGSIVKSVLGKKQQPQQPKVEQVVPSSGNDAGLVVPEEPQLEGVVNDTPREVTELCMPQSSSFPTSSLYPPTQATDCGVVESSTFEGDESFVTTKLETTFEQISTSDAAIGDTPKSPVLSNPFSHNNMGNEDAAPSSAPPMFSLDQEPKQPKEEGKEKKKETILSTPSQAGNKNVNKKKAPVSEPPRSAGWLSKLLRRSDPDSKATVADVGEEMQAYYDEKLKRWIFPGDDPAEVAKPLAPPPIIPKTTDDTPSTPAPTAPASNDPLAALMAPPPSGVLSKKKTVGGTSSRYASTPLASNKLPPASPMIAPPTFATFQPKPSKSEPSKEETGP